MFACFSFSYYSQPRLSSDNSIITNSMEGQVMKLQRALQGRTSLCLVVPAMASSFVTSSSSQ